MEEINKKTLIEALSSLQEHDVPDKVWDAINEEMESGADTVFTRQQLHHLPEHEPPADVWDGIENKIDGGTALIIPIGLRRALAIAASLALLVAAYFLIDDLKPTITVDNAVVTYSEESVDDFLLKQDWDEDEAAFEEFKNMCEGKKYICEHPEFQSLQDELEELTEAKLAISEAIGEFGTDPNLVIQIKEIELERTDILKKMMVMLI